MTLFCPFCLHNDFLKQSSAPCNLEISAQRKHGLNMKKTKNRSKFCGLAAVFRCNQYALTLQSALD